jgi:hypothetical protein
MEKNIGKYKTKESNVTKLKKYLKKIDNDKSKISFNTKCVQGE